MLIIVALAVVGLIFGSFAGAQVWRLRARQLRDDKANGEDYDRREYTRLLPLLGSKTRDDRSRCLSCGHQLQWIDLLPLVSWLSTRGTCRYCHKAIGRLEPLIEAGTALAFVSLYVFWPFGGTQPYGTILLAVWLCAVVVLAVLFAYDLKWLLLPDIGVFILVALGGIASIVAVVSSATPWMTVGSIVGSVAVLSGIYALLWIVSSGRWIGFGDVKLGLGLGLLLADWRYAFIALFAANLIGCIVVMPGLVTKKISRTSHIPFGPFLIVGTIVALLFGAPVVAWYSGLLI